MLWIIARADGNWILCATTRREGKPWAALKCNRIRFPSRRASCRWLNPISQIWILISRAVYMFVVFSHSPLRLMRWHYLKAKITAPMWTNMKLHNAALKQINFHLFSRFSSAFDRRKKIFIFVWFNFQNAYQPLYALVTGCCCNIKRRSSMRERNTSKHTQQASAKKRF